MIGWVNSGGGFRGCLNYVLGEGKHARVLVGNMAATTSRDLAREFGQIRTLRQEVKKPCWHASLSAAPGERLSDCKWSDVARSYLQKMQIDLSKHQYLVVRHQDTEHEHVHLLVNRIGVDGKLWNNGMDARRTYTATRQIELEHGLEKTIERSRQRTAPVLSKEIEIGG